MMQGDMKFLDVLKKMGCTVNQTGEGIQVDAPDGGILKPVDVDMNDFSDQSMTLAAIAPFAQGTTRIHNVGHIRRPEEYTVLSVLQCTEGSLAPVACLESKPNKCPKLEECKTITMWENFEKTINDYFNKITIADLINSGNGIDNYVI